MSVTQARPKFAFVNPASGEVAATFEPISEAELKGKLAKAYANFHQWRKTSYHHRAGIPLKIAERIDAPIDGLARVITREIGKPVAQFKAELAKSAMVPSCLVWLEK